LLRTFLLGVIVAVAFGTPTAARDAEGGGILRVAWIATGTGVLAAMPGGRDVDVPIDLQIIRAVAQRAHLGITIVPMERAAADAAIADGRVDLLLPHADAQGIVSIPYRSERDVLLCARHLPALGRQGIGALGEAYDRGWQIGLVRGAHRTEILTFVASGARASRTRYFGHAGQALNAIAAGKVQCLIAPRLSILSALGAAPEGEQFVARSAVDLGTTELRFRFADALEPEKVMALDGALSSLWNDGTIGAMERRAGRPVLLRFALATLWFWSIDAIGTVAFALSGVLIARAEGFSLLGAFVLAGLPAVGGGVIRDLLLGRSPIGILANPLPLLLVIGTVVVAYAARFAARQIGLANLPLSRMALEVTDAMGLAAFTVIGVAVAVQTDAQPLWLWGPLAAALSGAGGGVLRDLLRSGCENPALRTSFYMEVCILWGLALTLAIVHFLQADQPILIRVTIGVTVLGAFMTRMAVVLLKIRSPCF